MQWQRMRAYGMRDWRMPPFRRLAVWERAHALVLLCVPVIDGDLHRRYPGLAQQFRRAVIAIPAHLAEGAGHPERRRFDASLAQAMVATRVSEYYLLLARDLGVLSSKQYAGFEARLGEIAAMLLGLRRRVSAGAARGARH